MSQKQNYNSGRRTGRVVPKAGSGSGHRAPIRDASFFTKYGTVLIMAGILLLTFFVFSGGLNGKFLSWDDNVYVTGNKDIQSINVTKFFTSYYCGNFQPLTILTYAVEYAIVGKGSGFLYHLDNLLLHLVNVVLVFWLVMLWARKRWIAVLTAMLFALHPLRVESVSWISERKDVLYGLFFLLSLIMYHYYLVRGMGIKRDKGENSGTIEKTTALKYYLLVALFFILSGLSKSAATILPFALLLMDFLYKRRIRLLVVLEKLPLLCLSVVFGILAIKSQSTAIQDIPFFTLVQKILLVNFAFWRYIFMTFVPAGLSAYHPYPPHPNGVLPLIYYIAPVFTLLLAGGIIFSLKNTRQFAFAVLFFLVTIALVLQALPVGGASIAERYTYIPHVGLFFILSAGLYKLWEMKGSYRQYIRGSIIMVMGIGLMASSIITYGRTKVWKDSLTLWEDIAEKYPKVLFIYHNIAMTYKDQGNSEKAFEWYSKVIAEIPGDDEAYINRGNIYLARGNDSLAMADYNRAIAINPKPKTAEAYSNRGSLFSRIKKYDKAMADFEKAMAIDPKMSDIYLNRAITFGALGQYESALKDWDTYLSLKPEHTAAYNDRAIVKQSLKRHKDAIEDFNVAIRQKPAEGVYYLNRAISYYNLGDMKSARADAESAAKLGTRAPDNFLRALEGKK